MCGYMYIVKYTTILLYCVARCVMYMCGFTPVVLSVCINVRHCTTANVWATCVCFQYAYMLLATEWEGLCVS